MSKRSSRSTISECIEAGVVLGKRNTSVILYISGSVHEVGFWVLRAISGLYSICQNEDSTIPHILQHRKSLNLLRVSSVLLTILKRQSNLSHPPNGYQTVHVLSDGVIICSFGWLDLFLGMDTLQLYRSTSFRNRYLYVYFRWKSDEGCKVPWNIGNIYSVWWLICCFIDWARDLRWMAL
jgi:hypothetical protein